MERKESVQNIRVSHETLNKNVFSDDILAFICGGENILYFCNKWNIQFFYKNYKNKHISMQWVVETKISVDGRKHDKQNELLKPFICWESRQQLNIFARSLRIEKWDFSIDHKTLIHWRAVRASKLFEHAKTWDASLCFRFSSDHQPP